MSQSFGVIFAVCGILGGQDKALAVLGNSVNSVENASVIVGDIGVRDSVCPYKFDTQWSHLGELRLRDLSGMSKRLRLISMLNSGKREGT